MMSKQILVNIRSIHHELDVWTQPACTKRKKREKKSEQEKWEKKMVDTTCLSKQK